MRRLPGWALIVLVAAAGCSAMPNPGARSAEIEELKARVLELQRKAVTAEVEIARLREEMSRLRGGAPASASASAPRPAGVPATPPAAPPAPPPAPPTFRPAPPATGIEESDLEPAPPSGAILPPAAAPGEAGARPPSQPITALEPVTAAAQSLYDRAYTLYHQGRYAETETAFREFLQRHPRSELADNASYWVGESQYARGDLRSARQTFQDTVERYPTGNKTADALLKVGQCFEGLGDRDSARAAYDAVLERFVDSAAAEVARERRAKLR